MSFPTHTKYMINALAKEKEKEEYSAMVLFVSSKRLILTKDWNIRIETVCNINLESEHLMVSMKDFNTVIKTMDNFIVRGDKRNVQFVSGEQVINTSNFYNYNIHLCETLIKPTDKYRIGVLAITDIETLMKLRDYDRLTIIKNKAITSKGEIHIEHNLKGGTNLSFALPKIILEFLSKGLNRNIDIYHDGYSVHFNLDNYSVDRSEPRFEPDEVIKQDELEEIAVIESKELIKELGSKLTLFNKAKSILLSFKGTTICKFLIDGDTYYSHGLKLKTPAKEFIDLKINPDALKKALRFKQGPDVVFKIHRQRKILFIEDIAIPYR